MKLNNQIPRQNFQIYNPRWHDRIVLLADFKIQSHNVITFPKARTLVGEWYISGDKAKTFPAEPMKTKSGTTMTMRVVPIDELEPLEENVAEIAKNIKFGWQARSIE